MTGEPTAPVLERLRELAEQQDALDKRNAIDDRITDAFQRVAHAGVVLSLVEYVQANEAYDQAAAEAMHQDSAIYERAKAAFDDARARLFGLLGEAK